jgi:hypothetical protein
MVTVQQAADAVLAQWQRHRSIPSPRERLTHLSRELVEFDEVVERVTEAMKEKSRA